MIEVEIEHRDPGETCSTRGVRRNVPPISQIASRAVSNLAAGDDASLRSVVRKVGGGFSSVTSLVDPVAP